MATKEVIDFLNGPEFSEMLRGMVKRSVEPLSQDVLKLKENVERLDVLVNVRASVDRRKKLDKNKIIEYIDDAEKGNKKSADLFVEIESDTSSEAEDKVESGQLKQQDIPVLSAADAENTKKTTVSDFDTSDDEPLIKKIKSSD